ncbi:MAG: hypothetical protein PF572_03875 [Patescibacteria group bacterium]|jgi:hypothetical protein|nr:hypothetical protein [Patescibacteria group bacterium]
MQILSIQDEAHQYLSLLIQFMNFEKLSALVEAIDSAEFHEQKLQIAKDPKYAPDRVEYLCDTDGKPLLSAICFIEKFAIVKGFPENFVSTRLRSYLKTPD